MSHLDSLRELLIYSDPETLSDEELLAILLNSQSKASNLLSFFNSNLHNLFAAPPCELERVENVNTATACQLRAVLEVIKRLLHKPPKTHRIQCTQDIYEILGPEMMLLKQEEFRVVLLDHKNQFLRCETVSRGTVNRTFAHTIDIFKHALIYGVDTIMCVHNHPSGDPTPSPNDIELAQDLDKIADMFGITILDHVIIGKGEYVSMLYRGLVKHRPYPRTW
ncbi:MAG: DNA repair protein RadC [Theionarchaea archaeon]|nr:DNA repair protein RadC [Theionarchaea archaeon]